MLQKNIKRTRDKQVSMKISVRCNQNEFMLTYIHTYIHCLQVAISTPDGRSLGYPYITLKYLSLITYTQPKKGRPQHQGLYPLLLPNSSVGSFTSHKNYISSEIVVRRLGNLVCRFHSKVALSPQLF